MEAITREEKIMSGENLTPITRKEMFLAKAAGQDVETPEPITREEMFLSKINGSGGGTGGGGGEEETSPLTQLIEGTLTELCDEGATKVGQYKFHRMLLTKVDLLNVTECQARAFDNCARLAEANLPSLSIVGDYCFNGNSSLQSLNAPNITSIGTNGFDSCSSLESISLPKLTTLGGYSFRKCNNLKSIDFPILTTAGISAFYGCAKLVSINLPLLQGGAGFSECSSLIRLILPSFEGTPNCVGCAELTAIDCKSFSASLGRYTINSNPKMTTLVIRNETMVTMSAANALDNTPFASGNTGGTCYVPRALIGSYQAATNWSTLYTGGTCTFKAIEDYTVDGTITGEMDWDKIEAETT